MSGPVHITGGAVFTGVCASLAGINILADWRFIGLTVLFSLLPDIDTTHSILGRLLKPISSRIYDRWGHRTATHSIWFHHGATAATAATMGGEAATVVWLAITGHLLLDAITVSGVQYLYPRLTRFVLPGNDAARIRGNDKRTEAVWFAGSILAFYFFSGLIQNGFWTTYNTTMATTTTLASEFEKSTTMLDVTAVVRNGSDTTTVRGLVYLADGKRFGIVTADSTAMVLPRNEFERVAGLEFRRTEIRYKFAAGGDCDGIDVGDGNCLIIQNPNDDSNSNFLLGNLGGGTTARTGVQLPGKR